MAGNRPLGVTIVAILVLASGALSTITGIVRLFTTDGTFGPIFGAIVTLVIGVFTLVVGGALFARSALARILTAIVLVLQVAASIFAFALAIGAGDGGGAVWPAISGVLAIVGIVLLFTKKANAYFSRS